MDTIRYVVQSSATFHDQRKTSEIQALSLSWEKPSNFRIELSGHINKDFNLLYPHHPLWGGPVKVRGEVFGSTCNGITIPILFNFYSTRNRYKWCKRWVNQALFFNSFWLLFWAFWGYCPAPRQCHYVTDYHCHSRLRSQIFPVSRSGIFLMCVQKKPGVNISNNMHWRHPFHCKETLWRQRKRRVKLKQILHLTLLQRRSRGFKQVCVGK